MKRKLPEAVSIFVLPPDRKTLESRLRKRSEDAEEVIARRLVTASREIGNYDKYDYILINDDLEESIERPAVDRFVGTLAAVGPASYPRGDENRGTGEPSSVSECPGPGGADPCFLRRSSTLGTSLGFAVSF